MFVEDCVGSSGHDVVRDSRWEFKIRVVKLDRGDEVEGW